MKQLLEFIPMIAFVAAYAVAGIYWATAALMVTISLQLAVMWLLGQPIPTPLKLLFWASLLFGSLTIFYQNNAFIIWKPTIVNWLMVAGLLISLTVFRINPLERLLGTQLRLPDAVWTRLSLGWAGGFFLAGGLNLAVAYNFSEPFWVSYRLFGGFALTLVYVVITVGYLVAAGHLRDAEAITAADTSDSPDSPDSADTSYSGGDRR